MIYIKMFTMMSNLLIKKQYKTDFFYNIQMKILRDTPYIEKISHKILKSLK